MGGGGGGGGKASEANFNTCVCECARARMHVHMHAYFYIFTLLKSKQAISMGKKQIYTCNFISSERSERGKFLVITYCLKAI